MLSEKLLEEIKNIQPRSHSKKSACMAAMQSVQAEKGFLSKDDLADVAKLLEIEPCEAEEVGAFYTMYNVEKPVGRNHVQVCRNLSCSLLGAEHLVRHMEKVLGIKTGQTTADGKVTLSLVECLGSCGTAPIMQINDDYYENLTEEKVSGILKGLK